MHSTDNNAEKQEFLDLFYEENEFGQWGMTDEELSQYKYRAIVVYGHFGSTYTERKYVRYVNDRKWGQKYMENNTGMYNNECLVRVNIYKNKTYKQDK